MYIYVICHIYLYIYLADKLDKLKNESSSLRYSYINYIRNVYIYIFLQLNQMNDTNELCYIDIVILLIYTT